MFQKIGPLEIILIIVVILIVFGVGKLPQVGEAIGKGIRSFRKGQAGELDDETEDEEEAEEKPKPKPKKKTTKKN